MSFVVCLLLLMMLKEIKELHLSTSDIKVYRGNYCWKDLRTGPILQWNALLGRYIRKNMRKLCTFRSRLIIQSQVTAVKV